MQTINPNEKRIRELFEELVSIDSVSFSERQMADYLTNILKEMKFEVFEDSAGELYGGNAGNLYGFLKGTVQGTSTLFVAHMDTVHPGVSKKAVFHEDGKITSDGTTVLGSDDVAGIVEILEGIRCLQDKNIPHGDIEILFPIAEELYDKGSKVFDFSVVKSKQAYILDFSGHVGKAALRAPSIVSFKVEIKGKASHAGFAPEKGINAIALMAEGISKVRQGRMEDETTLNIGLIHGGSMTNIVSENCVCEGEIRGYHHERVMEMLEETKQIFENVIETAQGPNKNAELLFSHEINIKAYAVEKNCGVVQRFCRACEKIGVEPELTETFGGSDNNVIVNQGIDGVVLSCGMNNAHSVQEYIEMEDLVKGAALVKELILQS
ncbi:MAG: M20/M25/M40 family metallo-hydrolase [Lachnospiraceae bacterium]|nr:M20/M25/M40 family metallo-hydrolase [Lachnospiraceae bacterium]